jgi:TRAP-type uncharacterized transport system substrate-binding protein
LFLRKKELVMPESYGPASPPVLVRSKVALELAAELIGTQGWPYLRAHVDLRQQDFDQTGFGIFGSGSPDGIEQVAAGQSGLAMINPSAVLSMAYRGTGPYSKPLPVRTISVIPSFDQIVLGVMERTGLTSFDDIREQKYPLRVSLRGPAGNSVPLVANEICKAHGFTLDDIVSWGGEVSYFRRLPGARLVDIEKGEADAVFDEAVQQWVDPGAAMGMRFLTVEDDAMAKLESLGLRRGPVLKSDFPNLDADFQTVDFSGFPIFTSADVLDEQVTAICAALVVRKANIPWEGVGSLPLERMCMDHREGPLDVPLHPAAEAFWRAQGFLG